MPARLTDRVLAEGVRALARRDPDLARVVAHHGPPPLWDRAPGFPTLVQIILEQQVSLASGRSAYLRLRRAAGQVTPSRVALLEPRAFRRAGLTRQKSSYIRGLAVAVGDGALDLRRVHELNDESAHAELVKMKGIGPWSADIYLLMALCRPDVWPRHDLALASAMRDVKRLRSIPTPERQLEIAEAWRPWRAVAARLMWHHYLNR